MSPTALAVGEALIDEFPDRRVVAGAPLHVLAHLASLGWETALVTRVGDDPDGNAIVEAMKASGVGTSLVEIDPLLPTGTTTISLLPGGGHSFVVNRPSAWDAIAGPDPVPAHDVLVFGTLALRDPRSAATVSRLTSTGGITVVDLNLRMPDYDTSTVRFALEHGDLVKATVEEELIVREMLGIDSLLDGGARWACVTNGAAGASLISSSGDEWSVPAVPTTVIDAVGAGDAFLAGLIDGLFSEGDPLEAMRQAARLAADTLSRRGGMPQFRR
jgi:fructokinase